MAEKNDSLYPNTSCSTCSVCHKLFFFSHFSHVLVPCPLQSFLPSLMCLLFTNSSHLANDENSGENTCQENPHRLPCWCAKVGTYTLLKIMNKRCKTFSILLVQVTAETPSTTNLFDKHSLPSSLPSHPALWSSWADVPEGSPWSSWLLFWWCQGLWSQEPESVNGTGFRLVVVVVQSQFHNKCLIVFSFKN